MDEMITALEQKIRHLIEEKSQIKDDNAELQYKHSILSKEKKSLLTKQQQIISYIQALINKLKSIEMQNYE